MSDDTLQLNVWRDPLVRFCTAATLAGFLGFFGWAAFVPLDEGITANGMIVVENNRQVVQHLEGGIISELNVREGDHVEAGAPLIHLQDIATLARRDQILQAVAGLRASAIRIEALRGDHAPDFAAVRALGVEQAVSEAVIDRQQRLYDNQVASFQASLMVLEARRSGALETVRNAGRQIVSEERALAALESQLQTTRAMFAQQMARIDQIRELERMAASRQGAIARLQGEQAQARSAEADFSGQSAQLRAEREEALAAELVEVRERLLGAREELRAAQDTLDRSVIYAPRSGEIINMRFSTEGGVVRSGEPILEIVPDTSGLIAIVRVRPVDRARVFEGQTVRAQLSAYQGWTTPRLQGEVIDVSADLKSDSDSGESFYEARIRIPQSQLDRAAHVELMPGLPVSAFIFAGTQRTTLEYLFEPLSESLFRGLRNS